MATSAKEESISRDATIHIKESQDIAAFIAAISSKNYAQANKYLKSAINEKIKTRISKAASKPLF